VGSVRSFLAILETSQYFALLKKKKKFADNLVGAFCFLLVAGIKLSTSHQRLIVK
jgi:hypothetical protein